MFIVSTQVVDVPVHDPDQPSNVESLAGVAVKVTWVIAAK
jgi:hypothetical protein